MNVTGPRLRIVPHLVPRQDRPFVLTYLPLTMEIARLAEKELTPLLTISSPKWPFEDRVLSLLLPEMRRDIVQFYSSNGPDLAGVLNAASPGTIARLDREMLPSLLELLDEVAPRVADVVRRAREAEDAHGSGRSVTPPIGTENGGPGVA